MVGMKMEKKKIAVYVVCYGLAAAMLAFYLCTLYRGLHPHPSGEYRSYYLQQELSVWPGKDGLDIVRGQAIRSDSETAAPDQIAGHILREVDNHNKAVPNGWEYVQDKGYCITGWSVRLLFTGQPDTSYQGALTLETPEPGGEVTLFVNGEQVAFAEVSGTECTVEFETAVLPKDGRMELEIVLGGDMATPVSVKELIFT